LDLVVAERDRLQRLVHDRDDEVDYLREEKHMLLSELAEKDSTIADLEAELAESRRRHPSSGKGNP
jgi:predicted RNase H-like nuclease (RuvC/YqgF family)